DGLAPEFGDGRLPAGTRAGAARASPGPARAGGAREHGTDIRARSLGRLAGRRAGRRARAGGHLAADAGAAQSAVAAGILRQVLLVPGLRVVEGWRRVHDCG